MPNLSELGMKQNSYPSENVYDDFQVINGGNKVLNPAVNKTVVVKPRFLISVPNTQVLVLKRLLNV